MKIILQRILFTICLTASIVAKAQVTPLYFDGTKRVFDKDLANNYAVTGKLSNQDLWMFKRYDLDDNLIQTGSYKDENLTMPHGKFTFYGSVSYFNYIKETDYERKTGDLYKTQEGVFVDGKEQGDWKAFYPDGSIYVLQQFKDGKPEGLYEEADRKGRLSIKGQYIAGKKEGDWLVKYGKVIETFKDDVLVSKRKANKKR